MLKNEKKQLPTIEVVMGDMLGCGYYRCLMPFSKLTEYGYNVTFTNQIPTPATYKDADIFIAQRQHGAYWLEILPLIKEENKKVVYEIDDLLHDIPLSNPCRSSYLPGGEAVRNTDAILSQSDAMIVSTQALADFYQKYFLDENGKYKGNIFVCPNTLEDTVFKEISNKEKPKFSDGYTRLGWAGSGTHLEDLQNIIKPINDILLEFPKTKFVFCGTDYRKLIHPAARNRCEYIGHTFPLDKKGNPINPTRKHNPVYPYYEMLNNSKIDIAIAPISEHRFNRSKSEIKLLEYGMTRTAFVASATGPYSRYIKGFNWGSKQHYPGLLASSNSDWKRSLRVLLTDENLRKTLVENNLKNIESNYLLSQQIHKWVEVMEYLGYPPSTEKGILSERFR